MNSFIKYHKSKYPLMETVDIVKLLFQKNFGPRHFNSTFNEMINYYNKELNSIDREYDTNLYEHIGAYYIRVNINVYSKHFSSFSLISNMLKCEDCYKANLNNFKNDLKEINDQHFLDNYDYKQVSHSDIYKANYYPHYRVCKYDLLNIEMRTFQLQNYLDSFKDFTIFALEGKCASGKTTISNNLKDVTIIDVDDFFLSKDLKTPDRLMEIGGNIDYELYLEAISKIKEGNEITYKVFDCKSQSYYNKTVLIKKHVLLVGVYSYHEKVRQFIDKLIYLIVDDATQRKRVQMRDLRDKFFNEWIPLENKYYESYDFIGNADLLI